MKWKFLAHRKHCVSMVTMEVQYDGVKQPFSDFSPKEAMLRTLLWTSLDYLRIETAIHSARKKMWS